MTTKESKRKLIGVKDVIEVYSSSKRHSLKHYMIFRCGCGYVCNSYKELQQHLFFNNLKVNRNV